MARRKEDDGASWADFDYVPAQGSLDDLPPPKKLTGLHWRPSDFLILPTLPEEDRQGDDCDSTNTV